MSSQVKQQNNKFDLIKYKSLVGLLALIVIVSILSPSFLSSKNIFNILRQTSVNGIIAAGMTFVILTGGIDLSVGSILAISGAVCASLLVSGKGIFVAVLAALVIGALVGFLNGFIITKGKLQPFIATLATMTVLRGLTLVYTDGKPITLGSGNLALNFGQLGGTSLTGGKGKITGTIIGALIIGVLSNALNILDVSSYYQMMVKGAVILVAVLLDRKSN